MTELIWCIILLVAGFFLGWVLALRQEYWYIKMKAEPKWRTAMCIDGKFYYVVPESEYVSMQSQHNLRQSYDGSFVR